LKVSISRKIPLGIGQQDFAFSQDFGSLMFVGFSIA
jgi:hypothetical protein